MLADVDKPDSTLREGQPRAEAWHMIKRRRSLAAIATLCLCAVGVAVFVASRGNPETGPLGVPVHAADAPCVNSAPTRLAGRAR